MTSGARVCWMQTEPCETPGNLHAVLRQRGDRLAIVRLDRGDPLPDVDDFDLIVVSGGSMGTNESDAIAWMQPLTDLLMSAVQGGKRVLGICLGAQLLAIAAGGSVSGNRHCEIGWHELYRIESDVGHPLAAALPVRETVFHWHRDMILPPADAVVLARSRACPVQAFAWGVRALGVQFHPEMDWEKASIFTAMPPPCVGGAFTQPVSSIVVRRELFARQMAVMHRIIDALFLA